MTSRRRSLLAALLAAPLALRAQDIEVIELRHRSAEQVLPLLRPFVEPGGALTGTGFRLLLRASPANRRQLLELLRSLDTPPRQLLISVHQDLAHEETRRQRGADGSVTIDSRGIDGTLAVRADSSRSLSTRDATQQIRVLEGAAAFIAIGTAIPLTFRQWVATPQGLTELRGTARYESVTGFHARAQLAGDEVTLELTPEQSTWALEHTRLATTVRGRLGEWIAVGGAEMHAESHSGSAASLGRGAQSGGRGVWLKVEAAPQRP